MAWLERRHGPLPPGAPPAGLEVAVQAWNMMGGLDWNALPVIADLLGVEDMELLINQLVVIRNGLNG